MLREHLIIELPRKVTALAHVRHSPSTPLGHTTLLNLLQLAGDAIAGTVFLVWLFQARREAEAIGGAVQRWSTRWLVASWFVPVMSLWVPRRIVLDIWRAGEDRLTRGASALLNVWWACFVAETVVGSAFTSLLTLRHATEAANVVSVVRPLFGIAAALLGCYVIREITRSHARADRRAATDTPAEAREDVPEEARRPGTPDPRRLRQNVLIAVLFAALAVLVLGLVSFRSHVAGSDPDKLGYNFGKANPDAGDAVCDTEGERRYGSGYDEDDFVVGCLQGQLYVLTKETGG
jgi:hypothetical protein